MLSNYEKCMHFCLVFLSYLAQNHIFMSSPPSCMSIAIKLLNIHTICEILSGWLTCSEWWWVPLTLAKRRPTWVYTWAWAWYTQAPHGQASQCSGTGRLYAHPNPSENTNITSTIVAHLNKHDYRLTYSRLVESYILKACRVLHTQGW